ncbi:MAG: glycosyl transferase, partial [Ferrovum sp.]|nr:glycosyl transferase [Ferrovum sp.]
LSMDETDGVQKFHFTPTPRIGGIPVVLGLWVVMIWGGANLDYHAGRGQVAQLLWDLLIASLPAFVFGLLEDVTKRVGVMTRLLATMASGVFAWWLTGTALARVDVWGLDLLLASWWPLSVAFTAFAVGGVANALNIVDGFNGLASSTAFWACVGYALMAIRVNDPSMAVVCLTLAATMLGFFVINWPFGKLFLGDGGSYFTGFALAWLAVLLVERHPQISAFAVLVVLAYPVTEVLFTMFRRKSRQDHLGHPDRLHFHSLFKRRYVARWFKGYDATVRNSIA